MRILSGLFALLFLLPLPAAADYYPVQTGLQDLAQVGEGTVTEIIRPDMLRVDERVYVVDNIRVPLIYADPAIEWLNANVLNKKVHLYANTLSREGAAPTDRMGNLVVHIVTTDNREWVQGKLVGLGLAWADSGAENRDLIVPLLQIEDAARKAGLGFWAKPGMAVRTADTVLDQRNVFQIVEGRIVSTGERKDMVFANFGEDWKTDFTIRVTKNNYGNFPQGMRLKDMKDMRVRVRGWIIDRNGPMIDLTHPEQIEFLPDEDEEASAKTEAPAEAVISQ